MRMDEEDLGRMNKVLRHRLRNFASGVKSAVTLLESELKGCLSPDSQEYFPLIKAECDSLHTLTQRMSLLFDRDCPARAAARANHGTATVGTVLDRVLEQIRAEFPTAAVAVHVDEALQAQGLAGSAALVLALTEIVRNALESAGMANVTISCDQKEGCLCFRVADAGPGIKTGDPSQIFLPFHTSRSKHTGIGLSIAAEVLAEQGGRLSAETNPAGGLTVTAHIPERKGLAE